MRKLIAMFLVAAASPALAGGFAPGADARLEASSASSPPVHAADGGSDDGRALHFGPQIGYGDDHDLSLGARVVWSVQDWQEGLEIIASFDYFFPGDTDAEDRSYFEVNANLAYNFSVGESLSPYVGSGLNLSRLKVRLRDTDIEESATDLGVNLLGGVKLNTVFSGVVPFLEARLELDGGDQFVITVGALF